MVTREIIDRLKAELTIEAARMREINRQMSVSGEKMEIKVNGREIGLILYRASRKNAPLIVGYHGGGYLFGGHAMNDKVWKAVQTRLDANVVSVEYRKSPEYMWREALEDAYDAANYLYEHADEWKFDKNHIWVMGGSAGAGLATSVCLYAKQKNNNFIEKQILMYPFVDTYTDPLSKGEGSLQGPIMYVFNEFHCTPEEAKLPLVSPLYAGKEELEGMPEAIICVADYDCLKREGLQYAEHLKAAGVRTSIMECENMPHGFFEAGFGENFPGEFDFLDEKTRAMIESGEIPEASEKALAFIKESLEI